MHKERNVVLITGASHGIGLATATVLSEKGHVVYAGFREHPPNESKQFITLPLDVTNRDHINKAVDRIISEQGKIDVLINNAGIAVIGAVDEHTPEEVETLFRVNVYGPLFVTQRILPFMREKKRGHVITISSSSGIESSGFLGVYAATKFALEALISSWASVVHPWNIKMTLLEPGAVNTNLSNSLHLGSFYHEKESPYGKFSKNAADFLKSCLKNGASPHEIAEQILQIIEEDSPSLRYQPCPYSKEVAQKHLKDVTGTKWLEEHRRFMETLLDI